MRWNWDPLSDHRIAGPCLWGKKNYHLTDIHTLYFKKGDRGDVMKQRVPITFVLRKIIDIESELFFMIVTKRTNYPTSPQTYLADLIRWIGCVFTVSYVFFLLGFCSDWENTRLAVSRFFQIWKNTRFLNGRFFQKSEKYSVRNTRFWQFYQKILGLSLLGFPLFSKKYSVEL